MKAIPDELVPSLSLALRNQLMQSELISKMSEEEVLQVFSAMQGFEKIREMMESKTAKELIADVEIQAMIHGIVDMYRNQVEVIKKTLEILDSDIKEEERVTQQ